MKTLMIGTIAVLFAGSAMAADLAWDADRNGIVSADEYMAAGDRDATFNAWDGDRDGMLSADEFAMGNWRMFDENADNAWDGNETGNWMDSSTRSGREVSQ